MKRCRWIFAFALALAAGPVFAPTQYWYVSSSTYQGALADTAAAAGEHMCNPSEWMGTTFDSSLSAADVLEDWTWYDTDTGEGDTTDGDCLNWSSAGGSNSGHAARSSADTGHTKVGQDGGLGLWDQDDKTCMGALRVMICSDP